ncbi:hypothetical protein STEG23_012360 [Scotinomys teguina]
MLMLLLLREMVMVVVMTVAVMATGKNDTVTISPGPLQGSQEEAVLRLSLRDRGRLTNGPEGLYSSQKSDVTSGVEGGGTGYIDSSPGEKRGDQNLSSECGLEPLALQYLPEIRTLLHRALLNTEAVLYPTCGVRGRVASTVRYCMTVGGTVILVIGTLCFAWWSEDDTAVQPDSLAPTVGHPLPKIPLVWLKSVSLLCCSMGGLLLFFGLLWSIQESTKRLSQGDLYQLSRDLYHLAAESSQKSCRLPKEAVIPTYEEAMYCPLAEGPLQSPMPPEEEEEEEDLQCHTLGDALLGSPSLLPPPSYESIVLAQGAVLGPHAASSSPG